jgi:hypothetical protein
VASVVRLKEWITAPLFSKFILAEKSYVDELPFLKKKSVVVENKCQMPEGFQRKPANDTIDLVFTGTIAYSTGIFQAIQLAKELNKVEPSIRLAIIGKCSMARDLERVKKEISDAPFISLKAGNEFVSHEKIIKAISKTHFGIVIYPNSPHTENKIPTKLYEYLASELPILLQNNKKWVDLCAPADAAIVVDFENPNLDSIIEQIQERKYYPRKVENAHWKTEEAVFLTTIRSLI